MNPSSITGSYGTSYSTTRWQWEDGRLLISVTLSTIPHHDGPSIDDIAPNVWTLSFADAASFTCFGDQWRRKFPNLRELIVPAGTKSIPEHYGNGQVSTTLEYVFLPEGLESIGSCAFGHCSRLRRVDVPASVKQIGSNAFMHCDSLISPDGIAYDADRRWVLNASRAVRGQCTLPDTVVGIADAAFFSSCFLSEINLPKGLRYIGEEAFVHTRIKELSVPDGVRAIGFNAFSGIDHISYHGSAPTWVMGDVYDLSEDDQDPVFDWVWGSAWTRDYVENKHWGAKSRN